VALFEKLNSAWGVAMSAYDLGRAACCRHDWAEAARQLALAIDMQDEQGDAAGAAQSRVALARVRLAQGQLAGAADLLRAARQSYLTLKQTDALWSVIEGGAALTCARGRIESALRLYAAAIAQRDAIWDIIDPIEYERRARDLAQIRQSLGEETYAAAFSTATALSLDNGLALLREELG
jgi:hypothetical protein